MVLSKDLISCIDGNYDLRDKINKTRVLYDYIWMTLQCHDGWVGLILPYNPSNHVSYEFKGLYNVGFFHML